MKYLLNFFFCHFFQLVRNTTKKKTKILIPIWLAKHIEYFSFIFFSVLFYDNYILRHLYLFYSTPPLPTHARTQTNIENCDKIQIKHVNHVPHTDDEFNTCNSYASGWAINKVNEHKKITSKMQKKKEILVLSLHFCLPLQFEITWSNTGWHWPILLRIKLD